MSTEPTIIADIDVSEAYDIGHHCIIGNLDTLDIVRLGKRCNIRSHTIIYPKTTIGDDFTTGHFVLIREDCTIGHNVSIGSRTEIGPDVYIKNNVRIHSACFIPELTVIEDGAWLGPHVVVTNDKCPGPSCHGEKKREGVRICRDAAIGAGAVILPGVTVGAGAVVTKDVPAGRTVVGNPASVILSLGEMREIADDLESAGL